MAKRSKKYSILVKADKLLQEWVRLKYADVLCYVCAERRVTVGHHYIPKSNSNALRYYLPNIIPLCTECHCKVHTQPHLA